MGVNDTLMPTMKNVIQSLGPRTVPSPLIGQNIHFVSDEDRILFSSSSNEVIRQIQRGEIPMSFETAGPRREIFYTPRDVTACIVTCGGLCPGLNDVIRSITLALYHEYGVKKVLGACYGFEGLSSKFDHPMMELNPERVDTIHQRGGTILSTSRGPQDTRDIVDTLVQNGINMLFTIGGDGTLRGAHDVAVEIHRRNLMTAVVGIPKTIDNDVDYMDTTFGFSTAVEASREAILTAHEEARATWNGVGIVKLMGRESGFIASHATMANPVVNYCMIPEVPFELDGFLKALENRLERKRHAVIVVAEGVGQGWFQGEKTKDASGNIINKDVGVFLKLAIEAHFHKLGKPVKTTYIDPSYMIRGIPANSRDSALCLYWGNAAVHAAMAGKTDMIVGSWNQQPTHVPLQLIVGKRKRVDLQSPFWQAVAASTEPLSLS